MKFVRLIAVWLLMLALPLQSIAAYAPLAPCGDEHAATMSQAHESHNHGDQTAAADHDHPAAPGQSDSPAGHSCCHHVFSAAATVAMPGVPAAPDTVTSRVRLLSTLFIPELPQRPPRA
jgi:hypothetical protein